jgi:maleylpyruvate isomerase
VDCEVGVTPADWPMEMAVHAIGFLLSRVPPGVTLTATDTGQRWGPPDGEPLSGPVRDLAAWAAGRTPVHPLVGPEVELGEWPPHPVPNR